MSSDAARPKQSREFDPVSFTVVPPRRFEDLRVGDVFRAPSRTLTDAHAAAFEDTRRLGQAAPDAEGAERVADRPGPRALHRA